jgi:hypothetical protein
VPKMPEKFEDWTPPWGSPENIDPAKAGKLVFDLLKDQETNRAKLATDKKAIEALTAERDEFKDKAEAKGADDTANAAELVELKKQLRAKDAELERVKDYDTIAAERDRFDIALDEGLSKTQAKRLVGKDRDELLADATELKADLGIVDDSGDTGDQGGGNPRFNAGDISFSGRGYRTGGEDARGGGSGIIDDPAKVKLPPLGG